MSRSTARDLVKASLRTINAIGQSDAGSNEMFNDALDELNTMIESWNTDNLIPFVQTDTILNLVSGQSEYTIGVSGDINTAVPNDITQISLIIDSTEFPLDKVSNYEFNQRAITNSTGYPNIFTYRLDYPLATIQFYPTPSTGSVNVFYPKLLSTLTLNDTIALPHGYWGALQYGLAEQLLPIYGVAGDANALEIKQRAYTMKNRLQVQNYQTRLLGNSRREWDFESNTWKHL